MSEANDKSSEHDRELRRRFGSGDDEVKFDTKHPPKPDSLSPADSENDQRFGTDSDHVRKIFIDFSQFFVAEYYFRLNWICRKPIVSTTNKAFELIYIDAVSSLNYVLTWFAKKFVKFTVNKG